jgi:hypothetical protein
MYYPPSLRKPRLSGVRLIGMGIILFVLLLLALLFYLLALPAWQIRLAGVQTTAVAHEDGICAGDNDNPGDSYSFTYEFTDTHEHYHRVAQDSFCTDVYHDGDHVTIWYMPDDPTRILTDLQAIMLSLFSGIGAVGAAILLFVFYRLFIRPLRRNK